MMSKRKKVVAGKLDHVEATVAFDNGLGEYKKDCSHLDS